MMIRTAITLITISFSNIAQIVEHTHEGEVGKFYQRWMRPDNRYISCCNNQDCAAVSQVRRMDGKWQFHRISDDVWVTVPNTQIENYADDARDSPDGKSHLCSNGDLVFCAVLGSGA